MGFRSGKDVRAPVVDDLASLVWAANAGAIELHPFLGLADDLDHPTATVFDLDPGPRVGVGAVCAVALAVRRLLEAGGDEPLVKVSGVKGLHVWVPRPAGTITYGESKQVARDVAERLASASPDRVTAKMAKGERAGRVFLDWSQNDAGKSTVAPYSLRGLVRPTVSMPVRWRDVEAVAAGGDAGRLVVLLDEALERIEADGDLWATARPAPVR
jgi:bifunctional non-homologous end joining protein LigD